MKIISSCNRTKMLELGECVLYKVLVFIKVPIELLILLFAFLFLGIMSMESAFLLFSLGVAVILSIDNNELTRWR